MLWTKWSRETLQTTLVSPLLLTYVCCKRLPRNGGWYKLQANGETDCNRECEIDDATLLINARDWHFQPPEIENVLGWESFWNKPTLSHCCPTSRQRNRDVKEEGSLWRQEILQSPESNCSSEETLRSIINSVRPRHTKLHVNVAWILLKASTEFPLLICYLGHMWNGIYCLLNDAESSSDLVRQWEQYD